MAITTTLTLPVYQSLQPSGPASEAASITNSVDEVFLGGTQIVNSPAVETKEAELVP
jgi:hypothetical protein